MEADVLAEKKQGWNAGGVDCFASLAMTSKKKAAPKEAALLYRS